MEMLSLSCHASQFVTTSYPLKFIALLSCFILEAYKFSSGHKRNE